MFAGQALILKIYVLQLFVKTLNPNLSVFLTHQHVYPVYVWDISDAKNVHEPLWLSNLSVRPRPLK